MGTLAEDIAALYDDPKLSKEERDREILRLSDAQLGQGGVITRASPERKPRFEVAPPSEPTDVVNAIDAQSVARPPERQRFDLQPMDIKLGRAFSKDAQQAAGVRDPSTPMEDITAAREQYPFEPASAPATGLRNVTQTNARPVGRAEELGNALTLQGTGSSNVVEPRPNPGAAVIDAAPAAPGGPGAPMAPQDAGAMPFTPPDNVNAALGDIQAIRNLPQGHGGGPLTTDVGQRQFVQRTPAEQAAVDASNEKAAKAQQEYLDSIAKAGEEAQRVAASQAVAMGTQADFWRGRAEEEQAHRAAVQQEFQARASKVSEIGAKLEGMMAEAPLGTYLNPNGAQRVMGAIGLALGGFVQGIHGGPNPALEIIKTQIDAELAQRRERLEAGRLAVGAADTAFKEAYEASGSWDVAEQSMKATYLRAAQDKVGSLAELGRGDVAKANADVIVAGLKAQQAAAEQQAAAALGLHVTETQKLTRGGAGVDPLTREMRVQKLIAQALDNHVKMQTLAGKGQGQDVLNSINARQMQRQLVQENIAPRLEALERFDKHLKATHGDISLIARIIAQAPPGGVFKSYAENVIKQALGPARAAEVQGEMELLNDYILATTGKVMTTYETGRDMSAVGLRPGSTRTELLAGLDAIRGKLLAKQASIAALNPEAFRILEENRRAVLKIYGGEHAWESSAPRKGD